MNARLARIEASRDVELFERLRGEDISVPARGRGRTSDHTEKWSICRFLATYAKREFIQYPIAVEHSDRPDCVLSMPSGGCGVEITEAVPENAAAISAYRNNKEIDGPFFLRHHAPDEARLARKHVRAAAASRAASEPWCGESVEREWVAVVRWFIATKVEAASAEGFALHQSNWLLIYENWPLPALHIERAAELFSFDLNEVDFGPFSRVFVESSGSFVEITPGGISVCPVQDLWRGS